MKEEEETLFEVSINHFGWQIMAKDYAWECGQVSNDKSFHTVASIIDELLAFDPKQLIYRVRERLYSFI